jgi:hypothetical protein
MNIRGAELARRAAVALGYVFCFGVVVPAARAAESTRAESIFPSQAFVCSRMTAEEATSEYKANLERLLALYDQQRDAAATRAARLEALSRQQSVAKSEIDEARSEFARMDSTMSALRAQLSEADSALLEDLLNAEHAAQPAVEHLDVAPLAGSGRWSLTNAAIVQSYFQDRFKQRLPVSAFGQSRTHTRLGWDHRNAMDVAVNPDSPEGKALIAFLKENGIPFIPLRAAKAGIATGPHIHIGSPSHRL